MDAEKVMTAWGFEDPNMVGASEYRVIYDLLFDALDEPEGFDPPAEIGEDPKSFAITILDEIIGYAVEMKKKLGVEV